MGDNVELSVRSQLKKIVAELGEIQKAADKVSDSLKDAGEEAGASVTKQAKKTETFLGQLRSFSGRVSNQIRGDFKSLIALNSIKDSLKLSDQFRGSVKESLVLSDSIRKLGKVFGIARSDFSKLQADMVKGLGAIGLSSDVASRSLEGLSQSGTGVAGSNSLMGYSRASGQLASTTRSEGKEGDIAKLMAQVIQSKGGDVNDMKQLSAVAEDVRRVFNATGAGAADTLEAMKTIFSGMSKDFREKITTRGLANLAAASTVAGPASMQFLQEFLGKSPVARQALEAQGFKGVFTDEGIDFEKFQKASGDVMGRVGGDPRLAAQTLGISEEAAEGFVRLAESMSKVRDAQRGIAQSTGDLDAQYKQSMGFGEAFRASINRVKSAIATPLSYLSQKGTDLLSSASQSDAGAGAVVAGGGLLAALLAGAGLKGIGGALGGGMGSLAKGAAFEAGGRQVQPVYVVNASEIGGGGGLLGAASEAAGGAGMMAKLAPVAALLGKAGLVGAAGAAGYGIGTLANEYSPTMMGKTDEGFEGGAIERLIFKMDQLLGGAASKNINSAQKVLVELNTKDLKTSKQPTRGASF